MNDLVYKTLETTNTSTDRALSHRIGCIHITEYYVAVKMNKDYLHVLIGDDIENIDVPYILFI